MTEGKGGSEDRRVYKKGRTNIRMGKEERARRDSKEYIINCF